MTMKTTVICDECKEEIAEGKAATALSNREVFEGHFNFNGKGCVFHFCKPCGEDKFKKQLADG